MRTMDQADRHVAQSRSVFLVVRGPVRYAKNPRASFVTQRYHVSPAQHSSEIPSLPPPTHGHSLMARDSTPPDCYKYNDKPTSLYAAPFRSYLRPGSPHIKCTTRTSHRIDQ